MMTLALQLAPARVDGVDRSDGPDDSAPVGILIRWTGFAKRRPWVSLAALGAATQAVGLTGVPFTARAIGDWYDKLNKPSFNPPSSVFGPVWTALDGAMAGSAWLVSRAEASDRQQRALKLFAGQLVLNAVWTTAVLRCEGTSRGARRDQRAPCCGGGDDGCVVRCSACGRRTAGPLCRVGRICDRAQRVDRGAQPLTPPWANAGCGANFVAESRSERHSTTKSPVGSADSVPPAG